MSKWHWRLFHTFRDKHKPWHIFEYPIYIYIYIYISVSDMCKTPWLAIHCWLILNPLFSPSGRPPQFTIVLRKPCVHLFTERLVIIVCDWISTHDNSCISMSKMVHQSVSMIITLPHVSCFHLWTEKYTICIYKISNLARPVSCCYIWHILTKSNYKSHQNIQMWNLFPRGMSIIT